MKKLSVAVDGPAGAGKSSVARIVAEKLRLTYIDTGAMYRAVALCMVKNGIDIKDLNGIENILNFIDIDLKDGKVYLNGEDVSLAIREQEISRLSSPVSAIPQVRKRLVEMQRKMAEETSVIMDGRDIGTNVLKDADVKIFLTASCEVRAKRRYNELKAKGYDVKLETIMQDIKIRDAADSNREVDPLRVAPDAVIVDTTDMSFDDVVEKILSIIHKREVE